MIIILLTLLLTLLAIALLTRNAIAKVPLSTSAFKPAQVIGANCIFVTIIVSRLTLVDIVTFVAAFIVLIPFLVTNTFAVITRSISWTLLAALFWRSAKEPVPNEACLTDALVAWFDATSFAVTLFARIGLVAVIAIAEVSSVAGALVSGVRIRRATGVRVATVV